MQSKILFKKLWKKESNFTPFKMHNLNSLAASTPALDEKHIYSIWYGKEKTRLITLDHDGVEVWSKDFEATTLWHGPCTSPIVYNDMVSDGLGQMTFPKTSFS